MAVTGTEAKIIAALMTYLSGLSSAENWSVAWPNKNFKPALNSPYIRPDVVVWLTNQDGLPNDSDIQYTGTLQVSVFAPRDYGNIPAAEMASKITDYFKRGTRFNSEDNSITVKTGPEPPSIGTALSEDAWYHVPVSVSFFAFV